MVALNIENDTELTDYLVQNGHVTPGEPLSLHVLSGGVSNRAVLLQRKTGEAWVIKQALPKLRVKADWFSDPARIHCEALGMRWLAKFTQPRTIPELIFEDTDYHILAMSAVPQPHTNWKHMLLNGDVQAHHIKQFAQILADIHTQSYRQRETVEPVFRERQFFESLRVEPYYSYTSQQQPQAAMFYEQLIADTRQNVLTLVHGDYSPKNILVREERLVLLDHEVIHFGDPAFDIGFSMTHLLSKAHHVGHARRDFVDAAHTYWTHYHEKTTALFDHEERSVRHTLACLLARVDGRSPLDYCTDTEQEAQRRATLRLMTTLPATMPELIRRLCRGDFTLMPIITDLNAIEILDSRGRPTLQATCSLDDGVTGMGSVPSGASTGKAEAVELRDGDLQRYRGLGCRKAAQNVNTIIRDALIGQTFDDQVALDEALIQLDGSDNKRYLGANAILAVSVAFARAAAAEQGIPLYAYFANMRGESAAHLPRLTVNLFSGGKHAGRQVAIQDVLLVPISSTTIDDSLAMIYAVYQAAADLIVEKYDMRLLTADEGGLAPPFEDDEIMLRDAVVAIERAGYVPGKDMALAIDVASSHFFTEGVYHLGGQRLSGEQMVAQIVQWGQTYPLVSIEDGLEEEDWPHWTQLAANLPEGVLTLGDDLLCTNSTRIQHAIDTHAANALLLKVNQIGTFTEALDAYQLARSAGWYVVVSARSGETEDNWLADLAVGWDGDYIKVGSINQSERLAKYNRLLTIEQQTGFTINAHRH